MAIIDLEIVDLDEVIKAKTIGMLFEFELDYDVPKEKVTDGKSYAALQLEKEVSGL